MTDNERPSHEPLPAPVVVRERAPIPPDFDLASRLNVVYNRLFIDCLQCEQEEGEILYAAIGALRAAQPPFPEWQPIETAPVEMEAILMTDGEWVAAGHVDEDSFRKYRIHHFAVSQEYDWVPTHWMPLPKGPTATKNSEQS